MNYTACIQDTCMMINSYKKLVLSQSIVEYIACGTYKTNATDLLNITNCKTIIKVVSNYFVLSNNKIIYFIDSRLYSKLTRLNLLICSLDKFFNTEHTDIISIKDDDQNLDRPFCFLTSDGKLFEYFYDRIILLFDSYEIFDFFVSKTKFLLFDGSRYKVYNEIELDEYTKELVESGDEVSIPDITDFLYIDSIGIIILSESNLLYPDSLKLVTDSYNKLLHNLESDIFSISILIINNRLKLIHSNYKALMKFHKKSKIGIGYDYFDSRMINLMSKLECEIVLTWEYTIALLPDNSLKIFNYENLEEITDPLILDSIFNILFSQCRVYSSNDNNYI